MDYKTSQTKLEKKEFLVLYTDGVPEAADISNNLYEDDRLEKLILDNIKGNTKDITLAILDDVKRFAKGAEQSDDITIMVLRFY